MKSSKRTVWIDNIKVIAMIFVVLCHFSQSMIEADIISRSSALVFFNEFSYLFHIQLFFMCSGWLFQKYTSYKSIKDYGNNIAKKFIALGIPFFVFVSISHLLKTLFSTYVNNQSGSLLKEFFVAPMPPYWFLYVLFLIFLITPSVKNKKQAAALFIISIIFCVAINIISADYNIVYAVRQTLTYWVWFVFGIFISKMELKKFSSPYSLIMFAAACIAEIFNYKYSENHFAVNLLISFLACSGITGFMSWAYRSNRQTPIMGFLAKYTMPIYLMHTIFAAGIRSVLFKIGIDNSFLHIAAGLAATFIGPVIAAVIMEKIHFDFLIYPLKYIKIGKSKKKEAI